MKKLSSETTIIFRQFYPLFFGFGTLLGFLACLFGTMHGKYEEPLPWYVKWLLLVGGSVTTGWALLQAMLIQNVEMDGQTIIVSGWKGVERVPLGNIESISETRLRNPKLVIIRLRGAGKFGEAIRFIPTGRGVLFGEHPIVTHLNSAIKKAALVEERPH